MKIKELKEEHPAIYKRALECQVEHGNKPNDELLVFDQKRCGNFDWDKTIEKASFWNSICEGNFQVFYDRYPEHSKQAECEKSCGDNHCDTNGCINRKRTLKGVVDKPTEPKAGDMVEVSHDGEHYTGLFYFTGGKTALGAYVVSSNCGLDTFIRIRLPHKSEVEQAAIDYAKEVWSNGPSVEDNFKAGVKWGQQNPNAK